MKTLKYSIIMLLSVVALSSCSDDLVDSNWSPGEPSDAPGVYFDPDNETFLTLLGDESVMHLKMKRVNTATAISAPIKVVEAPEGMKVPATVDFAAGSDEAELLVDCSQVEAVKTLSFKLAVADEYVNPYAGGAGEFEGSVIVSRWENVSPDGMTEFKVMSWSYTDTDFVPMQCEMEHLLGSNRYRIKNFMDTEVDFNFELMQSPYKDNQMRIMPIGNMLSLADYGWGDYAYYNAWFLVSEPWDPIKEAEDEDYNIWTMMPLKYQNGKDYDVYYPMFMWYDDATGSEYCYVLNYDSGKCTAYMAFYGYTDEDMSKYTTYYRIRFAWKETRETAE